MEQRVPAVEVTNLSFRYAASGGFALEPLSFAVEPGEIIGLIGPNGAGKTTLVRLLTGFLRPSSGFVKIFGMEPELLGARRITGYQADSPYDGSDMTVARFLRAHALLAGVARPDGEIQALADQLGLTPYLGQRMAKLSKGNRQKAELAQAFLGKPRVVFLDEPTNALDPPSVFALRDMLGQMQTQGTTIFFNSHNLTEVEHVCSRIFFILGGKIVEQYDQRQSGAVDLEKAFRLHMDAEEVTTSR